MLIASLRDKVSHACTHPVLAHGGSSVATIFSFGGSDTDTGSILTTGRNGSDLNQAAEKYRLSRISAVEFKDILVDAFGLQVGGDTAHEASRGDPGDGTSTGRGERHASDHLGAAVTVHSWHL